MHLNIDKELKEFGEKPDDLTLHRRHIWKCANLVYELKPKVESETKSFTVHDSFFDQFYKFLSYPQQDYSWFCTMEAIIQALEWIRMVGTFFVSLNILEFINKNHTFMIKLSKFGLERNKFI